MGCVRRTSSLGINYDQVPANAARLRQGIPLPKAIRNQGSIFHQEAERESAWSTRLEGALIQFHSILTAYRIKPHGISDQAA
eukprot:scaffold189696_cov15-Tisochrysis_lutea.AAC.2